jgi:FtsH-binding integral membrane protein
MPFQARNVQTANAALGVDAGLRAYMLGVYRYMAGALALTGLVALFTANTPALYQAIFGSGLQWVLLIGQVGLVLWLSLRIESMNLSTAKSVFWAYAGLNGLTFAVILLAYTGESVARVFFITSASFGALSLYGYTTKRDLTAFASFLFIGLIGLVLASIVNLFLNSGPLSFVISAIGVLVFAGLTAYDTQKIRLMYDTRDGTEIAAKKSIMGALTLYLDFINLFIYLLRFLGDRR